jgi:hypothetical protein
MNEAQIQAQLAKNIPVDEPTVAPVQDDTPKESAFDSSVELNVANEGMEFFDYFAVNRIDRWSDESQRQVREVYRWAAQKAQSNELPEVFNQLRLLETELGIIYKPNRLQRLARWIELEKQTEAFRAQQEMIRYA